MRITLLTIIIAILIVGCVTTSDGVTVPYYYSSPIQRFDSCPNLNGSYEYITSASPGPSSNRSLMQFWFISALIESFNSGESLAFYHELVRAGTKFRLSIIGDAQTEFLVQIQQQGSELPLVRLKLGRAKGDYSCAKGIVYFRERNFSGKGDGHENLDFSGSTKLEMAIAEDRTLIGHIREVNTKMMALMGVKEINEGWPAYEKLQ